MNKVQLDPQQKKQRGVLLLLRLNGPIFFNWKMGATVNVLKRADTCFSLQAIDEITCDEETLT